MKTRMRNPEIGSISTGTLLSEDLFQAFLWECQHIKLSRSARNAVRKIAANRVTVDSEESVEERLEYDVEELLTILESAAPPYMYFGTHEGDGADFGFWLGNLSEFDGLRVNDTSEVPKGYSGEVLLTNDHGNVTLYFASRGRLREVWAVV